MYYIIVTESLALRRFTRARIFGFVLYDGNLQNRKEPPSLANNCLHNFGVALTNPCTTLHQSLETATPIYPSKSTQQLLDILQPL